MNVRINLSGLKDEKLKATLQEKMERLVAEIGMRVIKTFGTWWKASCSHPEPRIRSDSIVSLTLISTGSLDSVQDDGRLSAMNSIAVLHAAQLVTLAGPQRPGSVPS